MQAQDKYDHNFEMSRDFFFTEVDLDVEAQRTMRSHPQRIERLAKVLEEFEL